MIIATRDCICSRLKLMARETARIVRAPVVRNPDANLFWANDISDEKIHVVGVDLDPSSQPNMDYSLDSPVARSPKKKKVSTPALIKNKRIIVQYSKVIIAALQEVVDYDAFRQHNQPPPDLWIEGDTYIKEVRNLIAELKRLNELLEAKRVRRKETRRQAIHIAAHLNKFFTSYANAMGKIAAGLTGAAAIALISQTGVGKDAINSIWSHLHFSK
jgi:hypothetical protein